MRSASQPSSKAILSTNVFHAAIHLAGQPRPSPGAVAQPLPALAHGNLQRRQNAADRLPGVLGLHVAGTAQPEAFFGVDYGDGTLCAAGRETEFVIE